MDTISKIGGLLSTIKTIFTMALMFYSDLENSFQITKNILFKIYSYQKNFNFIFNDKKNNNINNNVNEVENNYNSKYLTKDDDINRKKEIQGKLHTDDIEHFLFSFCNCVKKQEL